MSCFNGWILLLMVFYSMAAHVSKRTKIVNSLQIEENMKVVSDKSSRNNDWDCSASLCKLTSGRFTISSSQDVPIGMFISYLTTFLRCLVLYMII